MNTWLLLVSLCVSIGFVESGGVVTGEILRATPSLTLDLTQVVAANNAFCALGRNSIFYWPVGQPLLWANKTIEDIFGEHYSSSCRHPKLVTNALETKIYLYFSNCPRHFFVSENCTNWKKMDNPLVYRTYSDCMELVPGTDHTVALFGENDGFICENTLQKCAAITGLNTGDDCYYGLRTHVVYALGRRSFLIYNESHVTEVSAMGMQSTHKYPSFVESQASSVNIKEANGYVLALASFNDQDSSSLYRVKEFASGWDEIHRFEDCSSAKILATDGNSIIVRPCSSSDDCDAVVSNDGGVSFKTLTLHNGKKIYNGPLAVASYRSQYVGVAAKEEGQVVSRDIVVTGNVMSPKWDVAIQAVGPTSLYPIVSLNNGSLLWGVEQSTGSYYHPCSGNLQVWLSTDGYKWEPVRSFKGIYIPDGNAYEYPPGSGQVIALISNCSQAADKNYGDLYYWPSGLYGDNPSRGNYMAPFASSFHTLYPQGIGKTAVAAGFPYGGDDGHVPSDSVWYASSPDGITWKVYNINGSVSNDCKFSYVEGLQMVGNGMALVYHDVEGAATCFATTDPPSFHIADQSHRFARVLSTGYKGHFIAATDSTLHQIWYSKGGDEWAQVVNRKPDRNTCNFALNHQSYQGIGIYRTPGPMGAPLLFGGGQEGCNDICVYDLSNFDGTLSGMALPHLGCADDNCCLEVNPSHGGVVKTNIGTVGWTAVFRSGADTMAVWNTHTQH